MINWNEFQKYTASLCAWREARGEGRDGMRAVIHVISNRAASPKFPHTWAEVVYQPLQFSSMTAPHDPQLGKVPVNPDPQFIDCYDIADTIWNGGDFDLTNGATNYFNPSEVLPDWAQAMTKVATIGNHVFYK